MLGKVIVHTYLHFSGKFIRSKIELPRLKNLDEISQFWPKMVWTRKFLVATGFRKNQPALGNQVISWFSMSSCFSEKNSITCWHTWPKFLALLLYSTGWISWAQFLRAKIGSHPGIGILDNFRPEISQGSGKIDPSSLEEDNLTRPLINFRS